MEGMNRQQPALACPPMMSGPQAILPPFTIPLPKNIMEGFSLFCQSLAKLEKKDIHH
ncbi:hypothetical protein QJS10_CPA10g01870 [Acorus calamus]|uniref:Uncharacterized protein n=1 Tax=Acorus calamus TaxID=4465 RepID=A0AAV9E0N3_ACOCL|nr:hypothetical protein QJS10_CPA10g01870 [Acorus calamus]